MRSSGWRRRLEAQLQREFIEAQQADGAVIELDGANDGVQVAADLAVQAGIQAEGEEVPTDIGCGFACQADGECVQVAPDQGGIGQVQRQRRGVDGIRDVAANGRVLCQHDEVAVDHAVDEHLVSEDEGVAVDDAVDGDVAADEQDVVIDDHAGGDAIAVDDAVLGVGGGGKDECGEQCEDECGALHVASRDEVIVLREVLDLTP